MSDTKDLLARSAFSFIATVVHVAAATMTDVVVDDHTVVVQVDHVLHAPDAFANMEGHRITVQLVSGTDVPAAGQSLALFVEGVAFGDSVVVREIGRLPVEAVASQAQAAADAGVRAGAFHPLIQEMGQSRLREHMQQCDAVVVGRVSGIEKAAPSRRSEHDPDWWRVTIDVFHVERGNVSLGPLKVLFANSLDVRWRHVPKPKASQGGLWLLHSTDGDLKQLALFQLLHPEDFQPTQQLDDLRQPGP